MGLVFETLQVETRKNDFTRRQALLIAPFALAGVVVLAIRKIHDSDDTKPAGRFEPRSGHRRVQ